MTDALLPPWTAAQTARLARWGGERAVDVHCHCLPGLDDGPRDLSESLALCSALVEDGFTTVVATPHQLGRYDFPERAAKIRAAVAELNTVLRQEAIPLVVVCGADVRIDERITRLISSGEVLTVADQRKHLLLELPHSQFVDPLALIKQLTALGVQTIMTHPERHRYLAADLGRPRAWIAAGARLQITAGSLLGAFGSAAHDYAWKLLEAGLVSMLATDAHHATERPPCMTAALDQVAAAHNEELARQLGAVAPGALLRGEWLAEPQEL